MPLQLAPEGDRISPPRDFDGVTALQLEVLVAEDHPVNREVLAALLDFSLPRQEFTLAKARRSGEVTSTRTLQSRMM